MKRQGIVYLVFALGSAAVFVYAVSLCSIAWDKFGLSPTFALLGGVAGVFAILFALYGGLSFVFLTRAVLSLVKAPGGFVLQPDSHARFNPVLVSTPKLVRELGAQFSTDESKPAFALFSAANKIWVTPAGSWLPREAPSDA